MSTIAEPPVEAEVVTDQPMILTGPGYGLTIAPSYEQKKAELLKSCALVKTVTDPLSDAAASERIADLSAVRITVEKCRKEKKSPALEFGAYVDDTAKTFSASIVAEETRLKKERGEYAVKVQQERQRVLAEMEAARQAEAKRLADEAAAAAKAEAARIAAEQAAFDATTPEEDAAAAKAAADAKAAELARLEAAAKVQAGVTTPAFVPEAVKGVKMVADYTIEDIDALYRWNVGLVTLTERRKEILETIARQTIGDTLPSIPGLRVFLKPQVR